jgi:hypothetical protein
LDDTYVERMQRVNWPQLYEEHNFGLYLEQLRTEWSNEYDFVLVDSRTGTTDSGGICSIQIPDFLMVFLTPNDQSLWGILDFTARALAQRNRLPVDRARLSILPVPTRLDFRSEYARAEEWLKIFAESLSPLYRTWLNQEVSVSEVLRLTRLPYVSFWSFGEELPVVDGPGSDPEDIGYWLENLAALLAHGFAHTDITVASASY